MITEIKSPNRFADAPRDKPQTDRASDHANLERPGAQAHPKAMRGWDVHGQKKAVWRLH
ncbi:MAG TPA: hypothetical protein VLJ58_05490 [Ramlibacter sp.]|nr:hypothetical protein [Ramlibacter sp.]